MCSILNLTSCFSAVGNGFEHFFWFLGYWPYALAVLGLIVLLWVLDKVKTVAGVTGEVLFIGVMAFVAGAAVDHYNFPKTVTVTKPAIVKKAPVPIKKHTVF